MTPINHTEVVSNELTPSGAAGKQTLAALEAEVTLSVNGEVWLGFRCSPNDLELLAVGFLFNESFINSKEEISSMRVCDDNINIDVWLDHACKKPEHWNRTSGCQGGLSQSGTDTNIPAVESLTYEYSTIQEHLVTFLRALNLMGDERTGVHVSFLFDGDQTLTSATDVGRHNTLDKIAGFCVSNQVTMKKPVIITTGRISSDMVLKAARMKVGLLLSLHSVSSLAIESGEKLGITLIGHARSSKLEVFTHPETIIQDISN
jgi:FdhD protein